MSKALSLKLQEPIFDNMEQVREIPRNTYINKAIEFFNKLNRKRHLKKQLAKASKLTYASSMEVLKEFEALDDPISE
ncbi:MAG: hypothetical protein V1908_01045 [Candidatus Peregrinibacteria bacterium]